MAWTPEKNSLLYQMLMERFSVESNFSDLKKWKLARSWTDIIDLILTKEEKQKVLNELINDKIVYIDGEILSTTDASSSLINIKNNLISSQEIVP